MTVILATPYAVIERVPGRPVVRMKRNGVPFKSAEELAQIAARFRLELPLRERAKLGIVSDLRDGPLRNDPEFESQIAPQIAEILTGFALHAVVVRTAVGKLQVKRQSQVMRGDALVFEDEESAVAHLTAALAKK